MHSSQLVNSGQLFWDYLEKLKQEDTEASTEDTENNNNENIEIGKTFTEMLKNGDFVPYVSITTVY